MPQNMGTCPTCKQYVVLEEDGTLKQHSVYSAIDDKFTPCPNQGYPE